MMSSLLRFSLVSFFIFPRLSQATITLTATGQHFASRPDPIVGTRFLQGFEYLARLQVFDHDLTLCPDATRPHSLLNLTVQVPPDGLPVAILARNTDCSVETKARLASYAVEPPHILKYIILYGDDGRLPEVSEGFVSYAKRHQSNEMEKDLDITVGILHISERSGNELLWTITNQSKESKVAGGPRLLLDGRDAANSRFFRDFTLWMGIGVMTMACLFSFFLSIRAQQGAFRSAPIEAPRRQERRRLTQEQVQELVPSFTASEYFCQIVDQESIQQHNEICSICLDEYAPNDALGELPCAHVFHCDCIAKWLTERSSTCPLCKTDLMPDDEDSDDEDSEYAEVDSHTTTDEDVRDQVFRSMDSFFGRARSIFSRRGRRRVSQGQVQDLLSEDEGGVSQQPLLEQHEQEDDVELNETR